MEKETGGLYTPAQAKKKAEHFCAYQERSQQEVRDKLLEWGLSGHDLEQIIGELITSNFLSEERFALSYALGKFRIKHWGRLKIRQGLKQKRVPENLINKAMKQISDEDYQAKMLYLIQKKLPGLAKKNDYDRKAALIRYLASKGYEAEPIHDLLNQ